MKRKLGLVMFLVFFLIHTKSYGQVNFERISGRNRIETAVEISKKTYPSSEVAILANSTRYVDALPGSTLASAKKGPILLVGKDQVPEATLRELQRLGVKKVYLLGGTGVLSEDILKELQSFETERISGKDRYETSYEIYKEISEDQEVKKVFFAANEVDAVASSGLRGGEIPLLYVAREDHDFLGKVQGDKVIIGGNGVISDALYKKIGASSRISGRNRYETAIALAKQTRFPNHILVNGTNLVDAFTAGTFAFYNQGNILLTETTSLPSSTRTYLEANPGNKLYLIGGEAAVSSTVFDQGSPQDPWDVAYWDRINHYDRSLLMSQDEIQNYNKTIDQRSPYVQDILTLSDKFSKSWITDRIKSFKMPSNPTKENGASYSSAEKNTMLANRSLETVGDTTALYGVASQRTILRTFPSYAVNMKSGYYDYFSEDAVNPWEKMMVLHLSKDKNWYFVLTENYAGWLPVKDVAITTKEELLHYEKMDFYVNTEAKANLHGWLMDMGTRIPRKDNVPLLPRRSESGRLVASEGSNTAGLSKGYLPYSEYQLVKQALKFKGLHYGWGGSRNGADCSSFIEDIHRVFGIRLPRNTGQQESVNLRNRISLSSMSRAQKKDAIIKSGPGSVLYLKGHVVLYLGKNPSGQDQIIHSYAASYSGGRVNGVGITDLNLRNTSSSYYLDLYTTLQKYR